MANGASEGSCKIVRRQHSVPHGRSGREFARRCAARWAIVCFLVSCSTFAPAEKRAARVYSASDGLPSNMADCAYKDPQGFIWCATTEGISRFDGYTFRNYGVDQGLPDPSVTALLISRSGDYWIGTARGLVRFNPKPGPNAPMFTAVGDDALRKVAINRLLEDHQGRIWVAIVDRIYELTQSNGQWNLRLTDPDKPHRGVVEDMLEDTEGNLWIVRNMGVRADLWRRSPDGHLDLFPDPFLSRPDPPNRIVSILQDHHGNIWLGTYHGLAVLVPHPTLGKRLIEHVWTRWDPARQTDEYAGGLFETSDGRLLVGSYGTYQIDFDARSRTAHFRLYDPRVEPPHFEDGYGNLWLGTTRVPVHGFTTFGKADGLATEDIRSVFEGHDGNLYVVTERHTRYIHRFDGKRFIAVAPFFPGHGTSGDWGGWGWGQIHLQDHLGEWWIATAHGLLRYPKVKRLEDLAHTPPKTIYTGVKDIFRLYEDSQGNIWVGAWDGWGIWERSTQHFRLLNVPGTFSGVPFAFREDRAGNMWIARNGIQRYRGGELNWVINPGSSSTGSISSLFLDHAGRMWAGSSRGGLLRFDHPETEKPEYRAYSTREGLSSNAVLSITEDHYGRIYFWTGIAVDRLDPVTGHIRHYTEADGLVRPFPDHNVAFCDRHGTLWFGLDGLSRLEPQPDTPAKPSPIRITSVRIRGVNYPVSELGETELSGLVLQPNENELQFEFCSLNFSAGDVIKYQYKLEGADNEWSTPGDSRSVNFPRVSPGKYRFLVRAVNADGVASEVPAVISFRIMRPIWMRWWFLTAVGVLFSSCTYWFYRFRLRQLVELERVRTRIASDLHDDIGSSLTQIAIMSEVARRQNGHGDAEPLERIADLSRELVDSMSDIVWAINPKRDQLSDLIQRMRRFANDVLEAADIRVSFRTELEHTDTPLHADMRREMFLIFKESVNNIARHAGCNHVDILVELKGLQVVMKISDDGKGFQLNPGNGYGHGLASMRERVQRLGGDMLVTSQPGKGTLLTFTAPLERSAFSSH